LLYFGINFLILSKYKGSIRVESLALVIKTFWVLVKAEDFLPAEQPEASQKDCVGWSYLESEARG